MNFRAARVLAGLLCDPCVPLAGLLCDPCGTLAGLLCDPCVTLAGLLRDDEEYPAPKGGWARCEHHDEQLGLGPRGSAVFPTKKITLPLRAGGRVSPLMGSWGSWGTPRPYKWG
eukprot:578213-Prorocentrum_minimum.AAC.1